MEWQRALVAVSEVVQMLSDIQRTWSYLEPLFIGSDEVRRELPEDAMRFTMIDEQVRKTLKTMADVKNVKQASQYRGLIERLDSINSDQTLAKRHLQTSWRGSGKFPRSALSVSSITRSHDHTVYRFYFTSSHPRPLFQPNLRNIIASGEADLWIFFQMGPAQQRLCATSIKVLLATASLRLESCLQASHVQLVLYPAWAKSKWFEPCVSLEGKVEFYMHTILAASETHYKRTLRDPKSITL